jgi:glycosyltransferase involved in cell wall biosynthesis
LITGEYPDGRICFLGWISGAEALARFITEAECLVRPSWSEGFPTVVGEATACCTLVLASLVGGISELVIEGQTGWLKLTGDDEVLRVRLSLVLAHLEVAAFMCPQVRNLAETRVPPTAVVAAPQKCFSPNHRSHD